ncbi:hypothetical protein L484_000144 [Morus notabilis]|uniref:Uncharacterized protein n=1 Tax=Morus notabilis TaxID=981085 RepID=W9SA76_9ROSA|nr:hypothetical protein L484_000144 [Morus notabilis]
MGNLGDARVEETRAGEGSVRAKRAYAWGQLGPTDLRRGRRRHMAAGMGSRLLSSAQLDDGLMGFGPN